MWLAELFLFAPSSSYDALLIIQNQSFYNVLFIHSRNYPLEQLAFLSVGPPTRRVPPLLFSGASYSHVIHTWSTRGQVTQGSPVSSIGSTLYIFSKLHGRGKILPTSKLAESSSSALNCIATLLLLTVPPSKAQWTPYQHHEYTCPLQCSFTDCKSRGIS